MARFVPARPLPDLAEEMREPLFAAEDFLDDIHVVVQPRGDDPGVILHPESGVFALIVLPGLRRRHDPVREVWVRSDGGVCDVDAIAAAAAASVAAKLGARPDSVVGIVHAPGRPRGDAGQRVVTGSGDDLGNALLEAIGRLSVLPIGDHGVQAAMDRLSPVPGGSPYVPNDITPQQQAWRDERSLETFERDLSPAPIPKVDDERLLRFAAAVVSHATGGRPARISSIAVDPADLAHPQFFLPAFLVAASDIAAPVVARARGKSGFRIQLVSDGDEALLGYRVARLSSKSPLVLMLSLSEAVRRTISGDEIALEAVNNLFRRFLRRNDLDHRIADDADVRAATNF
ncbi:hypothetical protein BHAOGJBA_1168 [Methylobacterium hispanicum]|uniref:Uncharacterized protein n=2 Tax=Methylobacterium hispanicum TaxID=270350 RepID=A0AAV4ZIC6_9HYPH|nr:hypothetical protein BHAOGJBA_1168 [Methylobacterium hispanicum]